MVWRMEKPAIKVADRLHDETHSLPPEVMRLNDDTAAIVIEIDGVDYILTMAKVPKQRERPAKMIPVGGTIKVKKRGSSGHLSQPDYGRWWLDDIGDGWVVWKRIE